MEKNNNKEDSMPFDEEEVNDLLKGLIEAKKTEDPRSRERIALHDCFKKFNINKEDQISYETHIDSLLSNAVNKTEYESILVNSITQYFQMKGISNTNDFSFFSVAGIKILLTLTKKILDKLEIRNFIGIQPMRAPVGLCYKLRDRKIEEDSNEEDSNEEDQRFATWGEVESGGFEIIKPVQCKLEVVSDAVEAGYTNFKTFPTIEAMQDIAEQNKTVNAEEFIENLSSEFVNEIHNSLFSQIGSISHTAEETITDDNSIISAILSHCQQIAHRSRRGVGNVIAVSPFVFKEIIKHDGFKFPPSQYISTKFLLNRYLDMSDDEITKEKTKTLLKSEILTYGGTLNKKIKIYINPLLSDKKILIAYRGANGETDNGVIYNPYVLLASHGVSINPQTFQPISVFGTRYGMMKDEYSSGYFTELTLNTEEKNNG